MACTHNSIIHHPFPPLTLGAGVIIIKYETAVDINRCPVAVTTAVYMEIIYLALPVARFVTGNVHCLAENSITFVATVIECHADGVIAVLRGGEEYIFAISQYITVNRPSLHGFSSAGKILVKGESSGDISGSFRRVAYLCYI